MSINFNAPSVTISDWLNCSLAQEQLFLLQRITLWCSRYHRVFTGRADSYHRWQWDWPRDQCVTVAQVRTGHSPLVAAYLHRIGRRDSAICPHGHSADETVEHLVFQCPAHDHARRDTWPGDSFTADPRRLWSYLERIGVVTRPPTGNERERDSRCQSPNFSV